MIYIYIYYSWNLANVSYLCFGKCMHACICICDINMYVFIYRPQINIYIYTQNLCVSLFASGDGGGIKVWGWHVVEVEQNQWLDRTTWTIWKQWALILWWEKNVPRSSLSFHCHGIWSSPSIHLIYILSCSHYPWGCSGWSSPWNRSLKLPRRALTPLSEAGVSSRTLSGRMRD